MTLGDLDLNLSFYVQTAFYDLAPQKYFYKFALDELDLILTSHDAQNMTKIDFLKICT